MHQNHHDQHHQAAWEPLKKDLLHSWPSAVFCFQAHLNTLASTVGIQVSFIIISLLRWSHWKTTAHLQVASSGSVGYFAASRVRACLQWVGTAEQFSGLFWPGSVLKMLTESVWTMLLSWLVPAHCSLDTKGVLHRLEQQCRMLKLL